MKNIYTPVIGLEVHVELKTKSKMFCGCSADYFGEKPNSHTCPVCLDLPGALPVPNKVAIEWCIKIALALGCQINEFSKFDRKNYFYPDLAKGYQISQYDLPFGFKGSIDVQKELVARGQKPEAKRIRIRRVHMEEDTGKLTHAIVSGEKVSLVDFNRSGVPLVEIVTEPDFDNEFQVVQYLQKLQKIVRYLDVSNADMERGDMRLEPNISLATSNSQLATGQKLEARNQKLPSYKVEVKNINSFKFVDRAIKFEIDRQAKILDEGKTPAQETRGWNETKNVTITQRSKEDAMDYRYFPEPDIPPIINFKDKIEKFKNELPELPDAAQIRFELEYSLSSYDSEILTREKSLAEFFEKAVADGKKLGINPKQIANKIINQKIDISYLVAAELIKMIIEENKKEDLTPDVLSSIIEEVLKENPQAVADYKKGKENSLMFLLGQVMRKAGKKLDANIVKSSILDALK